MTPRNTRTNARRARNSGARMAGFLWGDGSVQWPKRNTARPANRPKTNARPTRRPAAPPPAPNPVSYLGWLAKYRDPSPATQAKYNAAFRKQLRARNAARNNATNVFYNAPARRTYMSTAPARGWGHYPVKWEGLRMSGTGRSKKNWA